MDEGIERGMDSCRMDACDYGLDSRWDVGQELCGMVRMVIIALS